MSKILSTAISLTIIGCLLFGNEQAQQFAYYSYLVITVLGWIAVLCGCMTYEFVREEMKFLWLSIPLSVMTIYALIVTDHTALAASALVFALFFAGAAKKSKRA
ncbi:hypothetical protein DD604_22545 [Enterobacter cloacae]|uniref:hypothetical protein n=1 Tax=Enterobacter cloacae TaxID=550 RepID=UPI001012720F|nr:hypothetical protein [Enterobacter cloacae]RXX45953.1 hypothetical protein DD604_22545 [Enterobacter cloacae]